MTEGRYILLLSLHGLIRGSEVELGRDEDTGGQITYVLDLARALGERDEISRVDLVTRQVIDPAVAEDYGRAEEWLGDKARIVRLPFGPQRYLRKEALWPHLDHAVDRLLHFIRQQQRLPDIIHSHYADAGYVGVQLSHLTGLPLIHTGHSLGRCKRQRLLDAGRRASRIDQQFQFPRRFAAEEELLREADLIITSTRQEVAQQWGLYENVREGNFVVIPPGTDTSRFSPPRAGWRGHTVRGAISPFLRDVGKPMVLAIARPDARKNLVRLVEAFAESPALRERANLVIVCGNRDDIAGLPDEQKEVYTQLILAMDRYDLYGTMALPKHHEQSEVADYYRAAARTGGVFVNVAYTEPFGLTLIEAAASGLPIVATHDGGPQDIVANCRNGLLVDPLNAAEIAGALLDALSDRRRWQGWVRSGRAGVRRHYTWQAHVDKYLRQMGGLLRRQRKQLRREQVAFSQGVDLPLVVSLLVSDIDNTLLGDAASLRELMAWLETHRQMGFAVATGRSLELTLKVLRQWKVRRPDILISSVGSEIHYGRTLKPDVGWTSHIRYRWRRADVQQLLDRMPGLRLQPAENQREFKLSYYLDRDRAPDLREIRAELSRHQLYARLIHSHRVFLDVLPVRASKGQAVRYLAYRWGLPLERILVAGDSGNDREMLVGDTLAVVVGNHSEEIADLAGHERIYMASAHHAAGILEGIRHYGFPGFVSAAGSVSAARLAAQASLLLV